MEKMILYFIATMVSITSSVSFANYTCAVYFFGRQTDVTIAKLSESKFRITENESQRHFSCQKVNPSAIPREFRPENSQEISLALFCRISMFPSYYYLYANMDGTHAMPHLVEGGIVFSPIRCHSR